MNIETLAYNKRQIALIEQKISAYYQGRMFILDLVNDLLSLVHALREVPYDWRWSIIREINRTDCVYAVALDHGKNFLNVHDQQMIDGYIATIQSMLNDYKNEHKLDEFDEEYEEYKLLYPDDKHDDKKS